MADPLFEIGDILVQDTLNRDEPYGGTEWKKAGYIAGKTEVTITNTRVNPDFSAFERVYALDYCNCPKCGEGKENDYCHWIITEGRFKKVGSIYNTKEKVPKEKITIKRFSKIEFMKELARWMNLR